MRGLVVTILAISGTFLATPDSANGLIFHDRFEPMELLYPGDSPCDLTLQACIDAAPRHARILVAVDDIIDESIDIDSSLVLKAAPGFEPFIDGNITLRSSSGDHVIHVKGLTTRRIDVNLGAHDLRAEIAGNTVLRHGINFGDGIRMRTGSTPPYGDLDIKVTDNVVELTTLEFSGGECSGIRFGSFNDSGIVSGLIANNRVDVDGCTSGSGIQVFNGTQGREMDVDIFNNTITLNETNHGILATTSGSEDNESSTRVRIVGNVITGQEGFAGGPRAVGLSAGGGPQDTTIEIVNNTVAYNQQGLFLSVRTDLGASASGLVANNIIAFIDSGGLGVSPDLEDFDVRNNLVFEASHPGDPGPRVIVADPLFIAEDNLRVQPQSPAINAGDNSALPDVVTTDADGLPRIVSGTVDIGAYEAQ